MSKCGRVAVVRLSWLDNGEAGPGGQPSRPAFPKAFMEGFYWKPLSQASYPKPFVSKALQGW
jgi:hypothetical protein